MGCIADCCVDACCRPCYNLACKGMNPCISAALALSITLLVIGILGALAILPMDLSVAYGLMGPGIFIFIISCLAYCKARCKKE